MPNHPLVSQLRFARREFVRCLEGVSQTDAVRRLGPMNCLSWYVGHLANQEQAYWVFIAQDKVVVPGLNDLVGFGKPASTPPLSEMWIAWHTVTTAADTFLETLSIDRLVEHMIYKGKPRPESIGTMLQRNMYHYWFHTGEAHAVRQQLGHTHLPDFVGDMTDATFHPE